MHIPLRRHTGSGGRPALVHVDAYRLAGGPEVDDLELDDYLCDGVVVVEWGRSKVEHWSPQRLEVTIERPRGGEDTDAGPRRVTLHGIGPRWDGVDFGALLGGVAGIGVPS